MTVSLPVCEEAGGGKDERGEWCALLLQLARSLPSVLEASTPSLLTLALSPSPCMERLGLQMP